MEAKTKARARKTIDGSIPRPLNEAAGPTSPKSKEKPFRIFAHLTDGRTITLHVSKTLAIGELKQTVCLDHGYDPDQHALMYREKLLDEVSTVQGCRIKKDAELRVAFTMKMKSAKNPWEESASESSEAGEPGEAEIEKDDEQELASSQGSSSRSQATRDSVKKALTSGGLHARDVSPRRRELARKLAQERAALRFKRKEEQADLVSVISGVAQKLLPTMFSACASSNTKPQDKVVVSAKRHSWGGA